MLQILAESQRCYPFTPTTHTPHCKLIHRVQDRAEQEACLNTCAWLLAGACFAIFHAASFMALRLPAQRKESCNSDSMPT